MLQSEMRTCLFCHQDMHERCVDPLSEKLVWSRWGNRWVPECSCPCHPPTDPRRAPADLDEVQGVPV